ncbi:hypothetical protein CVE34_24250, partial [Pseudomonas syringae pv. actinidiae]|nr:hypothetical protein [Pseudomonas syringae pv. actinidiae]
PHAPAWECRSRRSASKEDAERPERHAHAEHGHDSVFQHALGEDSCSFSQTLQPANHAST